MRHGAVTFLWVVCSWFIASAAFGSFAGWILFNVPERFADATLTTLPFLGYFCTYGIPLLFLVLGVFGKLPGTRK